MRKLHAEDIKKPVDVICGGYPCQPFSVAGKQGGEEDDRHLWPEYFRLVQEFDPEWVIAENVVGHIKMGLDKVLSDLESENYSWWAFIIPSCAVGAVHKRERVWVVANSKRKRRKRYQQDNCIFSGKTEALSEPGYNIVGTWDELAGRSRGVRSSDGLPVKMVRSECKGYGNAVVPQITEIIGRAIIASYGC